MVINRQTMETETKNMLKILFSLQEIEKVTIKDIIINSPEDMENLKKSLEKSYHDKMSDVDIHIRICLNPVDFQRNVPIYKTFFPRLQIQDQIFGIIFQDRTSDERDSVYPYKECLRIVLKSGFRMDLICHIRCHENAEVLPENDLLEKQKEYISMKKTPGKDNIYPVTINPEKAGFFWFCTVQALAKLLRRDYLIADHLTHMLLMEGLVIQMEKRDQKYQTNFHRYGYAEELAYRNVEITEYSKYFSAADETYNHIACNLIRAVLSYDELASTCDVSYKRKSSIFFRIWNSYRDE